MHLELLEIIEVPRIFLSFISFSLPFCPFSPYLDILITWTASFSILLFRIGKTVIRLYVYTKSRWDVYSFRYCRMKSNAYSLLDSTVGDWTVCLLRLIRTIEMLAAVQHWPRGCVRRIENMLLQTVSNLIRFHGEKSEFSFIFSLEVDSIEKCLLFVCRSVDDVYCRA